jgi:hypothetical protein
MFFKRSDRRLMIEESDIYMFLDNDNIMITKAHTKLSQNRKMTSLVCQREVKHFQNHTNSSSHRGAQINVAVCGQ